MSAHVCHAHGCETPVPPRMFMCRQHWFVLRKPLRDAIWREYRSGQENDKAPSPRYMAVQRRAVAEVAFRPNDEAAALACTAYVVDSEKWRRMAIDAGDGDPLIALVSKPPMLPAGSLS